MGMSQGSLGIFLRGRVYGSGSWRPGRGVYVDGDQRASNDLRSREHQRSAQVKGNAQPIARRRKTEMCRQLLGRQTSRQDGG